MVLGQMRARVGQDLKGVADVAVFDSLTTQRIGKVGCRCRPPRLVPGWAPVAADQVSAEEAGWAEDGPVAVTIIEELLHASACRSCGCRDCASPRSWCGSRLSGCRWFCSWGGHSRSRSPHPPPRWRPRPQQRPGRRRRLRSIAKPCRRTCPGGASPHSRDGRQLALGLLRPDPPGPTRRRRTASFFGPYPSPPGRLTHRTRRHACHVEWVHRSSMLPARPGPARARCRRDRRAGRAHVVLVSTAPTRGGGPDHRRPQTDAVEWPRAARPRTESRTPWKPRRPCPPPQG